MLARAVDGYLDKPNYILQQKYDGTRCIIIKNGNNVKLIGRSWKNDYSNNFPEIVSDILKLKSKNIILDSELTFFKGNKDVFLTALATQSSKMGYIAKCMVFDILEVEGKDVRNNTFAHRNILLLRLIPNNLKHLKVVRSFKTNHKKIFDNIVSDEFQGEGVVLKDINSTYIEGARNNSWIKVKGWKSDEAIISGVTFGTGAREATFGALILSQYYRGKLVYVGKASGFKESEQTEIINLLLPLKTNASQLTEMPDKFVKYWVKPKIVAEIKYQEKTNDGKFRFPSFLRIRNDKDPKDCIKSSV